MASWVNTHTHIRIKDSRNQAHAGPHVPGLMIHICGTVQPQLSEFLLPIQVINYSTIIYIIGCIIIRVYYVQKTILSYFYNSRIKNTIKLVFLYLCICFSSTQVFR